MKAGTGGRSQEKNLLNRKCLIDRPVRSEFERATFQGRGQSRCLPAGRELWHLAHPGVRRGHRAFQRGVAARGHLQGVHARCSSRRPRRATASLDPPAEADVFRRFLVMAGGPATIVGLSPHGVGAAVQSDPRPQGGRPLIENGTLDELITRSG